MPTKILVNPENPNGLIVEMTAEEIGIQETFKAEVEAEKTANQYKEDRMFGTVEENADGTFTQLTTGYPSIQDQLDMQYWDAVNGTTTWKDAIAQVKADNPKPE